MIRLRSLLLPAVFFFAACGVLYAAQKALKVDVELVMVNISVNDSDGHPLTDLKAENFQVFEDKIEQKIRYFSILNLLSRKLK